jgi:hypothetical protein
VVENETENDILTYLSSSNSIETQIIQQTAACARYASKLWLRVSTCIKEKIAKAKHAAVNKTSTHGKATLLFITNVHLFVLICVYFV